MSPIRHDWRAPQVQLLAEYQSQLDPDPNHHFAAANLQIFNDPQKPARMQGFVKSYFNQQQHTALSRRIGEPHVRCPSIYLYRWRGYRDNIRHDQSDYNLNSYSVDLENNHHSFIGGLYLQDEVTICQIPDPERGGVVRVSMGDDWL